MLKNIYEKAKKYDYVIVIFIVSCLLLSTLFIHDRFWGHDTVFHAENIIELSKTIELNNIFGTDILKMPANRFGYGTYLFYPKLPHLLSAYLYKIFKNVYLSMNIIYFIVMFLSGIVMFLLSNKIFNNKKIALISSIIYLTIPYHITEMYIRDAYAENFMFLANPLIFLGLYHLKDNNKNKFYLFFILGYVIGLYSHLVSMLFTTIFVFIFLLYFHKDYLKKDKIKALFISTIIVTALVSPFLVKVIEYKALNIHGVFLDSSFTNRNFLINRTLTLKSLFIKENIDDVCFNFNTITIIMTILTLLLCFSKKVKYQKNISILILLSILTIILLTSKTLWKYMPSIFLMLQFSWRLLVFLGMLVSLYAPLCITYLDNTKISKKVEYILYLLIIIILIYSGFNSINYYSNFKYSESLVIQNVLALGFQKEYLPYNPKEDLYSYNYNRDEKIYSSNKKVKIKITENNFPSMKFEVSNLDKKIKIELPRTYYLGYHLRDNKGREISLYCGNNGLLKAKIKRNGSYTLVHTSTLVEKISNIVATLTIIMLISVKCKQRLICKNNKSLV